MQSTATPLDTNNFTFALQLQNDDKQSSHSSEFDNAHCQLAEFLTDCSLNVSCTVKFTVVRPCY